MKKIYCKIIILLALLINTNLFAQSIPELDSIFKMSYGDYKSELEEFEIEQNLDLIWKNEEKSINFSKNIHFMQNKNFETFLKLQDTNQRDSNFKCIKNEYNTQYEFQNGTPIQLSMEKNSKCNSDVWTLNLYQFWEKIRTNIHIQKNGSEFVLKTKPFNKQKPITFNKNNAIHSMPNSIWMNNLKLISVQGKIKLTKGDSKVIQTLELELIFQSFSDQTNKSELQINFNHKFTPNISNFRHFNLPTKKYWEKREKELQFKDIFPSK